MADEIMTKPRRKAPIRKTRRKSVSAPETASVETLNNPLRTASSGIQPVLRLITGVVLLLGGVVLLAGLTGCKKDPQKVVDTMLQVMMSDQIKTVSATGTLAVDVTAKGQIKPNLDLGDEIHIQADYTDKMDMTDGSRAKDWLDINLLIKDKKGNEISGAAELFEDGQVAYVKAKNIQGKGIMSIPSEAMDAIRQAGLLNQWIKIDVAALAKQYGITNLPMPETDAQKMKKLMEKYKDKRILSVSKDLGSQTMDGKKVSHYLVKVETGIVEPFIQDYLTTFNISAQQAGLNPDTKKVLMDSVNYINENGVEIFVGQKDSYLYGLKLSMPFSYPEATGTITLTQNYFDHNKTETLVAPTSFKTIEELLGSFMLMMGGSMGQGVPLEAMPTKDMQDMMKTQGMMQEDVEEMLQKKLPSR